ncbi:hypothetical protein D3C78_1097640 [compost metagenome]
MEQGNGLAAAFGLLQAGEQRPTVGQLGGRVLEGQALDRRGALVHQRLQQQRLVAALAQEEMHLQGVVDALQHLELVEGLGQEVAGAERQGVEPGVAVGLRAEHDHRRRLLAPARLELLEHLMAVQVRHADVQQDQVGQARLQQGRQLARVGEPVQVGVALLLEHVQQQLDVDRVVVQHQDARLQIAALPAVHQRCSRPANSSSRASSRAMSRGLVR